MLKRIGLGLLVLVLSLTATANDLSEGAPPMSTSSRRAVVSIVFAGLGGAVLGLSTLSFYKEPQDHVGNVASGFALGIIAGVLGVTYYSALGSVNREEDFPPSFYDNIDTRYSPPPQGFPVVALKWSW